MHLVITSYDGLPTEKQVARRDFGGLASEASPSFFQTFPRNFGPYSEMGHG